jgi:hypothetical protein
MTHQVAQHIVTMIRLEILIKSFWRVVAHSMQRYRTSTDPLTRYIYLISSTHPQIGYWLIIFLCMTSKILCTRNSLGHVIFEAAEIGSLSLSLSLSLEAGF